jgi:Relaxase/Mobilisation nuclease domain
MPGHLSDVGGDPDWLDIGSYARQGPGRGDRLSPAHVASIARTVRRTPEVMIKMLNHGGSDLGSVSSHLDYIGRGGELEIQTDDGEAINGKQTAEALIEDWGLDLDAKRPTADVKARASGGRAPKLVHKMILSMPAGTLPPKVLAAAQNFAREEFAFKHRYAMVLHTDEPHPHVHMVVRAIGHEGQRLTIRKATLREWRRQFARHLREVGVAANATERAVRGVNKPQKTDGIYRASIRKASTHWRQRTEAAARELKVEREGALEPGKDRLLATRHAVLRGWREIARSLILQNNWELATKVKEFVSQMPPVKTEREWIRQQILDQARPKSAREREQERAR